MSIIFCTACGARNRRAAGICLRCSSLLGGIETVDPASWEKDNSDAGPTDELISLTFFQRARMHPLVSAAALAGMVTFGGLTVWLFSYFTQSPKCVEYTELACSVIVLERPISQPEITISAQEKLFADLSFEQAEVYDWVRLLVIARQNDGVISVARLMAVSAGGPNWLGACYGIAECLAVSAKNDVDYNGLTGQAGITAAGGVQALSLASSSSAKPTWTFSGRVPEGRLISEPGLFKFEEVHLLSDNPVTQAELKLVAIQLRRELALAGITVRIRVTSEVRSRSSGLDVARIVVQADPMSLRLDGTSVKVELQNTESKRTWQGNFTATIEQLVDAVSNQTDTSTTELIIVDCRQTRFDELFAKQPTNDVEIVCFESGRFNQLITDENSSFRVFVVASAREQRLVLKIHELFAKRSTSIFVVRL